jgi:hypothetical protein
MPFPLKSTGFAALRHREALPLCGIGLSLKEWPFLPALPANLAAIGYAISYAILRPLPEPIS